MSPEEQQINTDTISVEPTVIEGSSVTMLFEETKTETPVEENKIETPPQTPPAESSREFTNASIPVTSLNISSGSINAPADIFTGTILSSFLAKANEVLRGHRQKKLEKILQFAFSKGTVSNSEAMKLLRVSEVTALRYLTKLTKDGKLHKVGSGRDTHYEIIR